MEIGHWVILIVSTVVTLGLYSSLTAKDNPWFAFAEQSYVSFTVGLTTTLCIYYIYESCVIPFTTDFGKRYAMLIAFILGLLLFTRFSEKYRYLSRLPISVSLGIGIGLTVRTTVFSNYTKQILATFAPGGGSIWLPGDLFGSFSNIAVVIFVLCMLSFFFYSTEVKGVHRATYTLGEYILYAAFGGLFAATYMGRAGLFIGRMETMVVPREIAGQLVKPLYLTVSIGILILVTIFILDKYAPKLMEKLVPE